MAAALRDAAAWVGCDDVRLMRVKPRTAKAEIMRELA
jgi:hypothetical protein